MGTIVLTGATSGSTTIQPTDAVTVTCTLPSTGGTLQTSGSGYTANGVAYASSTSALATGSALTFDGTNFTTPRILFGGSTLPAAGNPTIALRTSDNTIYHQSGSANTIVFLDSAQNTMQSISATAQIWNISNSEKMRLDSSGNLGIGTASAYANVNLYLGTNTNFSTAQGGISFAGGGGATFDTGHASGTASGSTYQRYIYNGSVIGSITQNGTTGVLYNLTSDYRLKNNPIPVTEAKEFIMALQPKSWDWWDGSGKGVGFIAHEFMEVAKYSGHGEKDAVDEEGKPVYQSIQPSSSEVMANLVAFIKEQQTIIESLTARITALEGKGA